MTATRLTVTFVDGKIGRTRPEPVPPMFFPEAPTVAEELHTPASMTPVETIVGIDWNAVADQITLYAARYLASRDIDVVIEQHPEGQITGSIIVGMFRLVGSFTVTVEEVGADEPARA